MDNKTYAGGFGQRNMAQATAIDEDVICLSSEDESYSLPPPPPQQQQQQNPSEVAYNNQSMKREIINESVSFDNYQNDEVGDQSSIPDDHNDNNSYDDEPSSDGNEFINGLKEKHQYHQYSHTDSGQTLLTEMPNTSNVSSANDYARASPMVTSTTAPLAAASTAPSPLQSPNYDTHPLASTLTQSITSNLPFDEIAKTGAMPQLTAELKAHVETCMAMVMKEIKENYIIIPKDQAANAQMNAEANNKQKRKHQHHDEKPTHKSTNTASGHGLRPKHERSWRYSSDYELEDLFGPSTSTTGNCHFVQKHVCL